jgi:hypothetical protein
MQMYGFESVRRTIGGQFAAVKTAVEREPSEPCALASTRSGLKIVAPPAPAGCSVQSACQPAPTANCLTMPCNTAGQQDTTTAGDYSTACRNPSRVNAKMSTQSPHNNIVCASNVLLTNDATVGSSGCLQNRAMDATAMLLQQDVPHFDVVAASRNTGAGDFCLQSSFLPMLICLRKPVQLEHPCIGTPGPTDVRWISVLYVRTLFKPPGEEVVKRLHLLYGRLGVLAGFGRSRVRAPACVFWPRSLITLRARDTRISVVCLVIPLLHVHVYSATVALRPKPIAGMA